MGEQVIKLIATLEQRKEFLYHLLNDIKALEKMVSTDLLEKNMQRIKQVNDCLNTAQHCPQSLGCGHQSPY